MLGSRNMLQLCLNRYEMPALLPGAIVTSGPKLLLLAMPRSMVLLHLGSVLMFNAQVTTGAHVNHMLKHIEE